MLKLRLKRYGRKKSPCYRIVATDSRVKRDGRAIEELGFYNPLTNETHLKYNLIIERLRKHRCRWYDSRIPIKHFICSQGVHLFVFW